MGNASRYFGTLFLMKVEDIESSREDLIYLNPQYMDRCDQLIIIQFICIDGRKCSSLAEYLLDQLRHQYELMQSW